MLCAVIPARPFVPGLGFLTTRFLQGSNIILHLITLFIHYLPDTSSPDVFCCHSYTRCSDTPVSTFCLRFGFLFSTIVSPLHELFVCGRVFISCYLVI